MKRTLCALLVVSAASMLAVAAADLPGRPQKGKATVTPVAENTGVVVRRVTFPRSNDITLVGNLFLPQQFDASKRYPAILCVHPAGSVKEQSAGLYAHLLAQQGFVTLAFDAAYAGESGGKPFLSEAPYERVEDIRYAVDYLVTLPFVHEERIGALGLCAGGGYVIATAPTERRIRALAGDLDVLHIRAPFLESGFKRFVRAEIENEHADSADQELENAMVDAIADASEVDIPECMVEDESKHKIEEFAYQLQYQGLNIDDYYKFTGSTEEDLMKRYHDSSLKSVKYRLVMQELIKQIGPIDVTDEQVLAFIKEQMGAMGDRYEKIADVPDEYVNYARSIETTKKVFALLREMNTVEDAVADASKAKKTAKKATKKADDAKEAPKAKKTAKKADKE